MDKNEVKGEEEGEKEVENSSYLEYKRKMGMK
jgi:hypothetical protein